jgi:SAM-dependent methyltransferase
MDIAAEPVPIGPWDVIHERLVLQHLPERLDVLARLVDALAPGGVILIEDFDTGEVRTVDRSGPHHELIVHIAQAFNRLLGTRGGVSDFAANALRSLRGQGLEGAGASGYVAIDHGGTGWAKVVAANVRQVRDGLVGQGVAPEDIDWFLKVLGDPDTIVGSSVMISAWARRASSVQAAQV